MLVFRGGSKCWQGRLPPSFVGQHALQLAPCMTPWSRRQHSRLPQTPKNSIMMASFKESGNAAPPSSSSSLPAATTSSAKGAPPSISQPSSSGHPLQDPISAHQNYDIDQAGLSSGQMGQLRTFLDYLLEVNQSMNLTAVRDPEEAWKRHVGDSLALLPVIDKHLAATRGEGNSPSASETPAGKGGGVGKRRQVAPGGSGGLGSLAGRNGPSSASSLSSSPLTSSSSSTPPTSPPPSSPSSSSPSLAPMTVIDVGTGPGLPGMIFAIARPHWKVTLLDSLRKRCDFLVRAAEKAGLTNVTVVWQRAEEGGQSKDHRERYDLAVARAVAETRVLAELCLPFVKVGGLWVAAKGPSPEVEVSAAGHAIGILGGKQRALDLVASWGPEGQRTAVVVAKTKATPSKYPRKPGTPNAQPL